MKRVLVNESLDKIRREKNLTEKDIVNDAKRLFNIASQNKVGNKIIANVPLYLIYIDDTYQRTETFSKSKANEIALNFIEAAYDPVKLNYREGRFYCPAGQHRIYAHILMKKETIGAELFKGTRNDEINIFLTQDDNRSKLTPYDRYKAGLACGKMEDEILHEVCANYGVSVGAKANAEEAKLGSVTTAKGIIQQYGKNGLVWIFEVIEHANWKRLPRAFDSRTFRALKRVYSVYGNSEIATKRLVQYMSKTAPIILSGLALSIYPYSDVQQALSNYLIDIARGESKSKMA